VNNTGPRKRGKRRAPRIDGSGPRAAVKPTLHTGLEYKRAKMIEIRSDIELCRERQAITALSALHRLECQLADEIEMALAVVDDPTGAMSAEELLGFILETILQMPQTVQDQIAGTLDAVRTGAIVALGDAPKKAKKARRAKR